MREVRPEVVGGSLFDSLFALATREGHACPKCGASCPLHLSFPFGLDVGRRQCVVLDAFLPDEPVKWPDDARREVTFYPFLVITDSEGGRGAWLPYWHVVRGGGAERRKYGQWVGAIHGAVDV